MVSTIPSQVGVNEIIFDDLFNPMINNDLQSKYLSVDEFNTFSVDSSCLTLCNYNIRSFKANSEEFFSFLQTINTNFKIIILTETRFSLFEVADIEGYIGHHSTRASGGGGGVSVYCDELLVSTSINHLCMNNDNIESSVIKVQIGCRSVIIIAIYRPPSGSIDCFCGYLNDILNDSQVKNSKVILLGDLNIDIIGYEESNVSIRNFVYSLFSYNFLPVINKPSRFPIGNQAGTPSLLDHIWINRFDRCVSGLLLHDSTDHVGTYICVNS